MIHRYEDELYYFVWKPHRIPTTRGNERSFLDILQESKPSFFYEQAKIFTREEEYGLVNRLDNDTAWLLYFAKTTKIYNEYVKQQEKKQLYKLYICEVSGKVDCERTAQKSVNQNVKQCMLQTSISGSHITNVLHNSWKKIVWWDENIRVMHGIEIAYPIMHHIHDKTRMVAVATEKDLAKGREKLHPVVTYVMPLWYNQQTNTTICFVVLHQWIRHQIRVHMAKVGYPIVGDELYNSHIQRQWENLHLWSVWLSSDLQFRIWYVL